MRWLKKLFGREDAYAPRIPKPYKDYREGEGIYVGDEAKEMLKWKQADIHNERGIKHFENDNFDKAIEEYRKAVNIWPNELHYLNLGNALVSKGAANLDMGIIREGKKALEEALRIKPGYERAERNLEGAKQLLSER